MNSEIALGISEDGNFLNAQNLMAPFILSHDVLNTTQKIAQYTHTISAAKLFCQDISFAV